MVFFHGHRSLPGRGPESSFLCLLAHDHPIQHPNVNPPCAEPANRLALSLVHSVRTNIAETGTIHIQRTSETSFFAAFNQAFHLTAQSTSSEEPAFTTSTFRMVLKWFRSRGSRCPSHTGLSVKASAIVPRFYVLIRTDVTSRKSWPCAFQRRPVRRWAYGAAKVRLSHESPFNCVSLSGI